MQTTPPVVSARTMKAFAVQPATRNIAQVAMRVAMVMPLIGFEELPMRPLMREATVTNKKPNTMTKMAEIKLANQLVCAPGTGWNVRNIQTMAIIAAEPTTTTLMDMSR